MRDQAVEAGTRACSSTGQSIGLRNRGSELGPGAQARFWGKVDRGEGCWNWTGARQSAGYGSFAVETHPKVRTASAHKVSWELANGAPVPAGQVVMHTCDNRRCVRPTHLTIGSVADNNADMHAKGRHGSACSRCRGRGHNALTCQVSL